MLPIPYRTGYLSTQKLDSVISNGSLTYGTLLQWLYAVVISGFFELVRVSWQRNNVESRAEKDFQTSDTTQRQLLMNKREQRFSFPIRKVYFNLYTQLFPFL